MGKPIAIVDFTQMVSPPEVDRGIDRTTNPDISHYSNMIERI
jgi:hypothetical protein